MVVSLSVAGIAQHTYMCLHAVFPGGCRHADTVSNACMSMHLNAPSTEAGLWTLFAHAAFAWYAEVVCARASGCIVQCMPFRKTGCQCMHCLSAAATSLGIGALCQSSGSRHAAKCHGCSPRFCSAARCASQHARCTPD